MDLPALQRAARAQILKFASPAQPTVVRNAAFAGGIRFSRASLKAISSSGGGNDRLKLLMVPALPALLAHAVYDHEEPPSAIDPQSSLRRVHFLRDRVEIEGTTYNVVYQVRETTSGHYYYNHRRVDVFRESSPPGQSAGPASAAPKVSDPPGTADHPHGDPTVPPKSRLLKSSHQDRDAAAEGKSAGLAAFPETWSPGWRVAPHEAEQTVSPSSRPALDESVLDGIPLLKARRLHGRRWLDGLHVSIENRRGSVRRWYDPFAGEHGTTTMAHPYGYVRRTIGLDGDQVDVFLGPLARGRMTEAKQAALRASTVYIVHTRKPPDFIELDEQKCFLGFASADEVRIAFATHYDHPGFFGQMDALPWAEFKAHVRATAEGNPMIRGEVVGRGPLTMAKASAPDGRITPAPLSLRGPTTAGRPAGPAQPKRPAADEQEPATTKPAATPEELAGHLAAARPALQKACAQAAKAFAGADVAARLRETTGLHARDADTDGVPTSGDDVASVRITVASIAEQQQAVDRVRRLFKVQREDDFLTKPTSGYRAYHFVVTVDGTPVELMLRTERQTRWADYAHDAAYAVHGQQAQPELRAYLTAMGAYLARLDDEGGVGDAGQAPMCPEAIAQLLGELDAS